MQNVLIMTFCREALVGYDTRYTNRVALHIILHVHCGNLCTVRPLVQDSLLGNLPVAGKLPE
jgi:hypothetical protein